MSAARLLGDGHDTGDGRNSRDQGFSMVEVLVGMALFGVIGSVLLGFAVSTAQVTDRVQVQGGITGESRVAMERMARELRQATEIDAVQFQSATTTTTAITFWTDFNGNGNRDTGLADPEVLTYRWDPTTRLLTLTANDASGTALTRPVLAATVLEFDLRLRSSLWQYDSTQDGEPTTWQDLDVAGPPVGNDNGVPDDELDHIDLVSVHMVVQDGDTSQTFDFRADLRNRNQT